MTKGKIFYYSKDPDLLVCECSACEHYRDSVETKIERQELTCRERLVNFLRKIIFR